MDWKGREQSQNVEDRRGSRGGGGGKTPGILGIIVVLVGAYYGVDLSSLVGGSSSMGILPSKLPDSTANKKPS